MKPLPSCHSTRRALTNKFKCFDDVNKPQRNKKFKAFIYKENYNKTNYLQNFVE